MKKSDYDEYENDFVKQAKENVEKRKLHDLNETLLERALLMEINKYLENNETIDQEIFDRFSHELRTPLVTIKSYIDLILAGKFGKVSTEQQTKLIHVSDNTDLLIKVIMQMLEKIKERK